MPGNLHLNIKAQSRVKQKVEQNTSSPSPLCCNHKGLVSAPATCKVYWCFCPCIIPLPSELYMTASILFFRSQIKYRLLKPSLILSPSKLPLPQNHPYHFPHGSYGYLKSSHSLIIIHLLFVLPLG